MSLRATARKAALAAFTAAGDAKVRIQLRINPIESAYDAASDRAERSWETVTAPIDAVAYQEKKTREAADKVLGKGDPETKTRNFIVLGKDLIADPDQECEIVEVATGIVWQVADVESDPTRTVYIFKTTA